MKKTLIIMSFIINLMVISSCGPAAKDRAEKIIMDSLLKEDSIKMAQEVSPDSIQTPETVNIIADTIESIPTKTEGSLVYYCPERMLENTDNIVSVTISKAVISEAITQLSRRIATTTGVQEDVVSMDVNGIPITISSKMKVELKYSANDFETIYQPENPDQLFDGVNDMNWDWIIKPLKVGNLQLTIVVSAFDENNGRWIAAQSPPKMLSIKVQVDPRGYFAKLWGFLGEHPEWIFMQIIIPLIAYFFGRKKGKKMA